MPQIKPAPIAREILLIDDHAIVREGVRSLFEDEADWVVVAEAGSGDEAVQALAARSADLAIMDLRMPGLAAAAAITMMRTLRPQLRVLVLTSFFVEAEIQAVLSAGANGLVLKDAARADIIAAARAVVDGDTWIQPSLLTRVLHLVRQSSAQRQILGRRELQVLELLGQGLSNKRIAAVLGIAEGTVKGYLREIYPKIGANDRLQAALYARGLLHADSAAASSQQSAPL
jgi:DNA-binding NarL/FixJ family response regulator